MAGLRIPVGAPQPVAPQSNVLLTSTTQDYQSPPQQAVTTAPTTTSTAPAGTTPDSVSVGGEQLVLDYLLNKTYVPNPLNPLQQVAPHFRLFAIEDVGDLYQAASNPATIGQLYAALGMNNSGDTQGANIKSIILAETGITTYNIKDVQLSALVGPSLTSRNTNYSTFTITIVEPMGVGFLDSFINAANTLKIRNREKYCFYLDLSFRAYDAAGNTNFSGSAPGNSAASGSATSANGGSSTSSFNPLSGVGYPNGGRWLWQIALKNIETSFDASGATYKIVAMPYAEASTYDDLQHTREVYNVTGSTIGEMLADFSAKMTKAWFERQGGNLVTFSGFKFDKAPTATGKSADPSTFSLSPTDAARSSQKGISMDQSGSTGAVTAHVPKSTSIADFIEFLVSNTNGAQNLAKDNDYVQNVSSATPDMVNGKQYRECRIFRVEPDVQIVDYDWISEQYTRSVTYHIRIFTTLVPVLDPPQKNSAANGAVQKAMVDRLYTGNFMLKRYDYLYTGLNTEILRYDISFNLNWAAAIPRLDGGRGGYDNVGASTALQNAAQKTPNALGGQQDPTMNAQSSPTTVNAATTTQQTLSAPGDLDGPTLAASAQQEQTSLYNAQDALTAAQTSLSNLLSTSASTIQIQAATTAVSVAQNTVNAAAYALSETRDQYNQIRNVQLGQVGSGLKSGTTRTFAEDLLGYSSTLTHPVSLKQLVNQALDNTGTGTIGAYTRDRSFYGAILEQLYLPPDQQMRTITLEIRGDPFWLGQSNLERQIIMRNTSAPPPSVPPNQQPVYADWYTGDMCFLLHYRYPLTLSATGAPSFVPGDAFVGVYSVYQVDSSFADGVFKQTLTGHFIPLIDVMHHLGDVAPGDSGAAVASSGTAVTPQNPVPASAVPANATPIGSPSTPSVGSANTLNT